MHACSSTCSAKDASPLAFREGGVGSLGGFGGPPAPPLLPLPAPLTFPEATPLLQRGGGRQGIGTTGWMGRGKRVTDTVLRTVTSAQASRKQGRPGRLCMHAPENAREGVEEEKGEEVVE